MGRPRLATQPDWNVRGAKRFELQGARASVRLARLATPAAILLITSMPPETLRLLLTRAPLLVAAVLASGCVHVSEAQYRKLTAGPIGCPSQEIRILGQPSVWEPGQPPEWRAECRGRKFICNVAGNTVVCNPELPPAESAQAAPSNTGQ
jgi:hypothetical protein